MTQNQDEKRGYQRGYNRASAKYHDRVRRITDIARAYRQRAADAKTPRTCATCDRWTRGAGQPNAEHCMWGSCRADFEWGLEPRMWSDTTDNQKVDIITQPDFGCVSWIPKPVHS